MFEDTLQFLFPVCPYKVKEMKNTHGGKAYRFSYFESLI